MAIGKSNTSKSFTAALNYVLQKDGAEFLYASGVAGETPGLIASQMIAVADMRNIKNPCQHATISAKIGEKPTPEQWGLAADAFVKKMGYDLTMTQYVVAHHTDTEHDHIHIVINRVQLNNQVVSDYQHKSRSFEATREAEKAAGLTPYESKKDRQIKMSDLRQSINNALKESKGDFNKFKIHLAKHGIETVENRSKTTNLLSGISYKMAGEHYKGSQLGKEYSLHGLKSRGLQTDQLGKDKTKSLAQKQAHSSTSAQQTQSRVDRERAKLHGHTNQAKANQGADENKRLQTIRHHEESRREEEYEE